MSNFKQYLAEKAEGALRGVKNHPLVSEPKRYLIGKGKVALLCAATLPVQQWPSLVNSSMAYAPTLDMAPGHAQVEMAKGSHAARLPEASQTTAEDILGMNERRLLKSHVERIVYGENARPGPDVASR